MRAEDFFLLINEIDDGLVAQAEGEKKSPERRFSFAGILPAAAILAGIIAGIFVIISIRMNSVREQNCPGAPNAYPYVIVNGTKYLYDDFTPLTELPEGYIAIGSVLSNDLSDDKKEGYSEGCKVGDIIYQNPGNTSEVFVYTKLFKGNGYWYIRFVQLRETAESTPSAVSKADVSSNSDNPSEPPMFFKEPQPEDIVFDAEHGVSYVKNQLLISAELGAPEEEMQRIFDELGAEVVGFIELTNDYQIEFKTDKTLAELEAAANYIDSFSFVQGVTLNLILDINYDA